MQYAGTADAAGAAAAPAAYRLPVRPIFLLRSVLLLMVIGNVGRIPFLNLGERQAPVSINDLGVAAVIVVGALAVVNARSLRLNDVALTALLFAGVGALSAVAAVPRFNLTTLELVGSLAYLARWAMYFMLYLFVINCVRASDVESLWGAMERALLLIAAFGIVQAIFLPDFAFMVYPDSRKYLDWDVQGHRLVSTILDPNIVGGMIAVGALVQVARVASGSTATPLWKPLLMFLALMMTLSRSSMLAFLTGAAVIWIARGAHRRVVRLVGLIALAGLAALPQLVQYAMRYSKLGFTDDSALARLVMWDRALTLFLEYPWFGVGFNTYGFVQDHRGIERLGTASYGTEGGILFIGVMTGMVGIAIYVGMLWLIWRRCRRFWSDSRATAEERGLLLATGAVTAAILVHTMFVNSLFTAFVMEILWVLWGLSFVIAVSVARRSMPEPGGGIAPT